MKTIKDYTSFVNENIKEAFVDVELDQDVIDYYLEVVEKGVSKEEAVEQVAADFGISDDAVKIIVDQAGITESVETEEEEEEILEESVEETEEEVTEEIIEEAVEETTEETEEEVIEESVEETEETEEEVIEESVEETEEVNEASDEDEYLSAKQKKLPDALKAGIIKKMKKAGKKAGDKKDDDKKDDDKKDDKKDDDKKDDKKDDSSKSDEEKYLSPKQRKLPEGLKKGIIKKAKAKK